MKKKNFGKIIFVQKNMDIVLNKGAIMYRIIDSRGSGKTSRLFLLAKENHGIVICSNPNAMKRKALDYGIVGIDFMSYQELIERKDTLCAPLYFDELEAFVKCYISEIGHMGGYTLSNED